MTEAELIFTALAELSTRQIAETDEAKGLLENAKPVKRRSNCQKRPISFRRENWKKCSNRRKFSITKSKRARVNLAILAVRKIQKMTNLQFIAQKVATAAINIQNTVQLLQEDCNHSVYFALSKRQNRQSG